MEATINSRIAQLIATVGLTKSSFSKKLEVSPTSIGYITGDRQTKPSFELLEKMAGAFPALRMEWLVRGKGNMLSTDTDDSDCQQELRQLGHKFQDLERDHERLQVSYARQAKLLGALGGPHPEGE